MMTLKKCLMFVLCLSAISNAFSQTVAARPTLILVHGALLTSSIWEAVQSNLQNSHYNVVTLDVPGRAEDGVAAKDATLDLAAKKVCDVARMQHGSVVLVGHSQAGAVINQAIDKCSVKIKALVYLAAVVPLNGETPYELLSEEDGAHFDACAKPDAASGLYQIDYSGPIKEMFMMDASEKAASRAIANMVPEPIVIGENQLHFPTATFVSIPKFYIETTQDKIISPQTQQRIYSRIHFEHIYSLQSSHSPFLSRHKQLSKLLGEIVESLA